jgi:hypothetical protein
LAVFFIIFGGITTFKGRKFFNIIIAVLGGGLAFLISMLTFSLYGMTDYLDKYEDGGSIGLTILAFVLALAIGALVGFLLFLWAFKVGVLVLGVIVGGFLGVLLYNTILFKTENVYILYACVFVLAALGGWLSSKYHDHIMIFGTSFIGSYIFIRGISLFAGHYPSESEVIAQLQHGIEPEFEWKFYLYLVAILVMFIAGSKFQFHEKDKEEGEEKEGYKRLD